MSQFVNSQWLYWRWEIRLTWRSILAGMSGSLMSQLVSVDPPSLLRSLTDDVTFDHNFQRMQITVVIPLLWNHHHLTTAHHKIYERLTILTLRLIIVMILAPVQPAPQDKENRANVKRPGVRIHLGRRTHLDDDDVYAMNMKIISQ